MTSYIIVAAALVLALVIDAERERWARESVRSPLTDSEAWLRESLTADDFDCRADLQAWEARMQATLHRLAEEGASIIAHEWRHTGKEYLRPKERKVRR